MKILGIDSSGMVAGVAIIDDEITIAEYTVNYKKTHSETLLPMLDEIVSMTGSDLNDIDAFAVAAGPGSFTGLRIGAATVKGLALATEKPVISVPTCHALAYNLWGSERLVCPILDARRSQVYTGLYHTCKDELAVVMDQTALDIDELTARVNEIGEEVIFLGDGVPVYRDRIDEIIRVGHSYAPVHMNRQRAASVASLGARLLKEGEYVDADDFRPIYLRKSQAEREREEMLAAKEQG